MSEVKRKKLLRRSTKENQINLQIDSSSAEFESPLHHFTTMNLPRNLTIEEKKYLLAVRDGNLSYVKRVINEAYKCSSIDINCVDSLGRGALNLAIESENLEMVELLIISHVQTKDALLHAINAEFVEAVELLLEYEEHIYVEGEKYSWEKIDWNIAAFTPDITPLILAAHKNNFEILKVLLERGATIPKPHHIGCGCSSCTQVSRSDSLRHSMSRVNEYRALASPSLIALTSNDPVLTSFKLSWELRKLAKEETEYHHEYNELKKQCQQFAVELLDQTRNSKELTVMLNHENNCEYPISADNFVKLPLLHLAIKYRQKKFVAHPHVQQLLSKIWYDGLPGFRSKSLIKKSYDVAVIGILFPVYCISYMLLPESEFGQTIKKPIMKFLIHVTSYLLFLGLLILVSQRAEVLIVEIIGTERMKDNLQKSLLKQRGNGPTFLEWNVLIYVLGYMKQQVLEMKRIGVEKYVRSSLWNTLEVIKNCIYLLVIGLRMYAYVHEQIEIQRDPSTAFIPREKWSMFDPQLIAEGFFATANILSALKLVHIFSVNSHLGPLQISLGRMFIDIFKFFSIYALVLFSFACGLNQLLWYYAALERKKCFTLPGDIPDWENASDSCSKWRSFGNLFESLQTLFWTGFGEVGVNSFDLSGINSYTRFWGLLMFAAYSVLNVTVLLNLLIAMMSNSYSAIAGQSDTEWKFARTKLWINFFEEKCTLPSPYNILPTKKTLKRVKTCFKNENTQTEEGKDSKQKMHTHFENKKFSRVMRALVWRYISAKHRESEMNSITEDHVQEIRGDISSLKFLMYDVLEKCGIQTLCDEKKDRMVNKKLRVWERQLTRDFHIGELVSKDYNDGRTSSPENDGKATENRRPANEKEENKTNGEGDEKREEKKEKKEKEIL